MLEERRQQGPVTDKLCLTTGRLGKQDEGYTPCGSVSLRQTSHLARGSFSCGIIFIHKLALGHACGAFSWLMFDACGPSLLGQCPLGKWALVAERSKLSRTRKKRSKEYVFMVPSLTSLRDALGLGSLSQVNPSFSNLFLGHRVYHRNRKQTRTGDWDIAVMHKTIHLLWRC